MTICLAPGALSILHWVKICGIWINTYFQINTTMQSSFKNTPPHICSHVQKWTEFHYTIGFWLTYKGQKQEEWKSNSFLHFQPISSDSYEIMDINHSPSSIAEAARLWGHLMELACPRYSRTREKKGGVVDWLSVVDENKWFRNWDDADGQEFSLGSASRRRLQ